MQRASRFDRRAGVLAGVLLTVATAPSGVRAAPAVDVEEHGGVPGARAAAVDPNDPTQGAFAQAVGFYSDGALINGLDFPLEGPGFVKIFRLRDRGWATHDLIEVITRAASAVATFFPGGERLQLGDASARAGGPISRHASHQNGLDVDTTYYNHRRTEQDPLESERGFTESFVRNGRVTANFDIERNWAFVKALVSTGRIGRIFVDPAIKQAFCRHAERTGELRDRAEDLRRLRGIANHDDHFHVRITCPRNSPACREQEPPPPGTGCAGPAQQEQGG